MEPPDSGLHCWLWVGPWRGQRVKRGTEQQDMCTQCLSIVEETTERSNKWDHKQSQCCVECPPPPSFLNFLLPPLSLQEVVVCGHSLEVNVTSNLDFYLSVAQVQLLQQLLRDNLVGSNASEKGSEVTSDPIYVTHYCWNILICGVQIFVMWAQNCQVKVIVGQRNQNYKNIYFFYCSIINCN